MPSSTLVREYGHHRREGWVKCRVCGTMTLALFFVALVGFTAYGALYIPYLTAYEKRADERAKAERYVQSDVCKPAILAQLGRHGEEDCAAHKKILERNTEVAASLDVLHKLDLCKDGVCMVLSFNLITFVSTFLPWFLAILVVVFAVFGFCLIAWAVGAMRSNNELPYTLAAAIAEQQQYRKQADDGQYYTAPARWVERPKEE